ncbi:hypothetical protein OIU92_08685 [Escherichia coli]|nr:hypothetical protein [Escherichia coli]
MVSGVAGIQVRETVPDPFSMPPTTWCWWTCPQTICASGLKEGKVYIAGQAERAIEHFFPQRQSDRPARNWHCAVLPIALMSKCAPGEGILAKRSLAHARRDPFMHRA